MARFAVGLRCSHALFPGSTWAVLARLAAPPVWDELDAHGAGAAHLARGGRRPAAGLGNGGGAGG